MYRLAHSTISLILALSFLLFSAPASALEGWMQERFGETMSVRGSPQCAIIHSPLINGKINDSFGYKVSGHDADELRQSLILLKARADAEDVEGRLNVTNLPMWSQQSREFLAQVHSVVDETGLSDSIEVKAHYVPSRSGLVGALEKIRYFFPMKQDYEKPLPEEIWAGVPATGGAEMTSALYALSAFPPEVSAPLLASHFGLLLTLTAFRRTLSNWQNRSGASLSGSFMKQALTSGVFIANYRVMANWPEIYSTVKEQGFGAAHTFAQNGGHFLADQGVTTMIQTVFFWLTFSRGVYRWEAMVSQSPEMSKASRRTAALVTPAIFWVSGPMLMWASTSDHVVAQLGSMQFNPGQIGLLTLAAGGAWLSANPMRLQKIVPVFDRWFYRPIDSGLEFIKRNLPRNGPNSSDRSREQ